MFLLYHPIRVIVKCHPEVILSIDRCKKHSVALMLLNDTSLDAIHKIGETILRFL